MSIVNVPIVNVPRCAFCTRNYTNYLKFGLVNKPYSKMLKLCVLFEWYRPISSRLKYVVRSSWDRISPTLRSSAGATYFMIKKTIIEISVVIKSNYPK